MNFENKLGSATVVEKERVGGVSVRVCVGVRVGGSQNI